MGVNKEKYNFRVSNHLCTRCGEPVVFGKKQCQHHLDEAALKEKLKRERYKNKNLCMRCGKVPPRENKIYCEECFQKDKRYYPKTMEKYYNKRNSFQCVRCKTTIKDGAHCENCKIYMKAKDKIGYYRHKTNNLCVMCGNEKGVDGVLCFKCQKINNCRSKKIRENQKKLIINHYGSRCFCCGETNIKFLTIDHINNDGNKHKIELKSQKTTLYRWIIKNNFPENMFQVACYNCNCARSKNNFICPHQQKLTEEVSIISVGVPTQG